MGSLFQIGGLVSGIDTRGLIDQLLQIEARPIFNFEQQKSDLELVDQAYADIGARVANLSARVSTLLRSSSINAKSVTTTTASPSTAAAGILANSDAANQTFQLTILQLATTTEISGTTSIGSDVTATADITDTTEGAAGTGLSKAVTAGTFTVGIDGTLTQFTVTAGDSLNDVITSLNATFGGGFASVVSNRLVLDISVPGGTEFNIGTAGDTSDFLEIVGLADAVRDPGTAATVTGGVVTRTADPQVIVLNGETITVDLNDIPAANSDMAQILADAINAIKSTTKVTATVTGAGSDQITLTHDDGGSGNDIALTFASSDTGLTAATTSGTNLNTITSARPVGIAQVSAVLDDARLDTAVTAGTGSFTINGETFTYDTTSDSINGIISDINGSDAGVTAAFDPVEGKILLTAKTTGSQAISMANVTGNFLTAVGLLAGTQTLGDQAEYAIDVFAGGATQTSSSNTVNNALPGVTVTLNAVDEDNPITVTVGQDIGTAVTNAQRLVDQFNSTVSLIEEKIAFDADSGESGLLLGDPTITGILRNLRTFILADGDGLTSEFTSLVDVGFSFDAVGSSSLLLKLDQGAFGTALVENPDAVADLFSERTTSTSITTSSGTVVASITGTEDFRKKAGTYTLVLDTAGTPNLTVTFVPDDGGNTIVTTNDVSAGEVNTGVIPGVTITFEAGGTFASGTDVLTITVPTKGVAQKLDDLLDLLLGTNGAFDAKRDSTLDQIDDIDGRIRALEEKLLAREVSLIREFSALELALVRLQRQQSALTSLIGSLNIGGGGGFFG